MPRPLSNILWRLSYESYVNYCVHWWYNCLLSIYNSTFPWSPICFKLQEAVLAINLRKSKFCLLEVTLLGHVVNIQDISADPSKVEAIGTYPEPRNLKSSILGGTTDLFQTYLELMNHLTPQRKRAELFSGYHSANRPLNNWKHAWWLQPSLDTPT